MTRVVVRGLAALEGETAFAFLVVRLRHPGNRAALLDVLRYIGPLVPDIETFIGELPEDLDEAMRIIGIPWSPPEAGHAVEAQRRLIEGAAAVDVEAAWFFQTGTSLPATGDEGEEEDHEDKTTPIELVDVADLDDDEDDAADDDEDDAADDAKEADDEAAGADAGWSHGPPPAISTVRFPVDGYPEILDTLDWEDFGIAFKLAGDALPGEGTVLLGFHTLWLAPYAGRFRNTAVTFDRRHHAAHLWVDRFAVPCSTAVQAHHLLWILARLDEITPVIHARFAGASMAQKYGGLMGDTSEPFVLGGNPLLAIHTEGGETAVDAWLSAQQDWSPAEVAQMLRELAIEIVTGDADAPGGHGDPVVSVGAAATSEGVAAWEDGDDEDDAAEGSEDADPGRQITTYAGEVLRARAAAGRLDPRAAEHLIPVLEIPQKFEHRRRAIVEILGALRYRAAVPAMVQILDDTTIEGSLDSIGKEDFVAATAAALGAIGDPAAIAALSRVAAAPGTHNDKARPIAADALATCLAAAPEPHQVDDAVLVALLTTIRERNDGELNAETHFAYGRVARQLPPERRADARRRLEEVDSARDDATAMLARHAALVLASPTTLANPPRELQALLREGLTSLDYDHDYTVRNLRVALRVAEVLPELVDVADLTWLCRFAEPDIRSGAHALLEKLGHPMPLAPLFDRQAARALDDAELVRWIGEPHVVGRAALVTEAGRRELAAAKGAIVRACQDVISVARPGSANLLDPDSRLLEAAVAVLRRGPLAAEVVALFDRMLRHPNVQVKWRLLQAPPADERLIGGMFHVLGEKWGWQEKTARQWLVPYQGREVFELERRRAGSPVLEAAEADAGDEDGDDDGDDEDMN